MLVKAQVGQGTAHQSGLKFAKAILSKQLKCLVNDQKTNERNQYSAEPCRSLQKMARERMSAQTLGWREFLDGITSADTPQQTSPSYPLPSGMIKLTSPIYPDKGAKNNRIDGVYGPKTANAVKRFQLMNGLTADGIYGSETKAKLKRR